MGNISNLRHELSNVYRRNLPLTKNLEFEDIEEIASKIGCYDELDVLKQQRKLKLMIKAWVELETSEAKESAKAFLFEIAKFVKLDASIVELCIGYEQELNKMGRGEGIHYHGH